LNLKIRIRDTVGFGFRSGIVQNTGTFLFEVIIMAISPFPRLLERIRDLGIPHMKG